MKKKLKISIASKVTKNVSVSTNNTKMGCRCALLY